MGIGRGLRELQLRPLQLADLRLRTKAERFAVTFARTARRGKHAAARQNHSPATDADATEALKQSADSSLDSAT